MSVASFGDFYRAVHGRDPFPWQARLAETVVEVGWPSEIGVPTGLGKTACLDIAVWSLATQADRAPAERTLPTRVWYVVNRRLLVDAASDHAERLAQLLADPLGAEVHHGSTGRTAVQSVAEALLTIGHDGTEPLFVRRLRGGGIGRSRPAHPAHPAICCATVPMFGSRLLFRGYGVSQSMWPIEAALAGTDSLVLLDEAHLAPALQQLVTVAVECDARNTGVLRPPGRFRPSEHDPILSESRMAPILVSLTATGIDEPSRFDLADDDRAHPVVQQRLEAAKPTELIEVKTDKQLAAAMARRLVELIESGERPAAGVAFANTPRTARAVAEELQTRVDDSECEILVLTGQVRDPEAAAIRSKLLDPEEGVPSTPSPLERARSLVVVATQTLEVGADVDFDYLVSEMAGVRALTQRLGRLNRLGVRPHAAAALVHRTGRKELGLYGSEVDEVWSRLQAQEPLDLAPGSISTVMGEPADEPPYVPEMLPSHMWEFAKTASPPNDAAPPDLFFSGLDESPRRVSLCWRAVLPGEGELPAPRTSEAEYVVVSLADVRGFFERRGWREPDWNGAVVLDHEGRAQPVSSAALVPGARVIVRSAEGGYTSGWDPDSSEEVLDLSPYLYGEILLHSDAVANALGRELSVYEQTLIGRLDLGSNEIVDPEVDREVGEEIAELLASSQVPSELLNGLDAPIGGVKEVERIGSGDLVIMRLSNAVGSPRSEESEELTLASTTTLDDHLQEVASAAAGIAAAVGIRGDLSEAIRLGALYHDLGKADPRFQRWLGSEGSLLAKSAQPRWRWERMRAAAGWPRGGRHELIGLQLLDGLEDTSEEPELVRHLVASHHGRGRPLVPPAGAQAPLPISARIIGVEWSGSGNPGEWRWDQPIRFKLLCERFGYWGLALLEAVVRQADHHVSRIGQPE